MRCHIDIARASLVTEKFTKTLLLGDCKIEATLRRLERLTKDEAQMTAAQTLGVVHGLVGNVKAVMEGAECLYDRSLIFL